MSKRRILRAFQLGEISAVDRPAQTPAKKTIIKRDFNNEERRSAAESGEALPDGSFPIKNKSDLSSAVQAYGRAKDKARAKRHIIRRARALNAVDVLPDDWNISKQELVEELADTIVKCYDEEALSFSEVREKTMELERGYKLANKVFPMVEAMNTSISSIFRDGNVSTEQKRNMIRDSVAEFMKEIGDMMSDDDLEKFFTDPEFIKVASAGLNTGHHVSKSEKDDDMTDNDKRVAELEKQLAEIKSELEVANAERNMTDVQKAFYSSLKGPDAERFLKMSGTERNALIDATEASDEVIKVDGKAIRKSVVGDDVFEIIKKREDRLAEAEKKTEEAKFTKRAEEELPNLPGEAVAKGRVLAAIEKMSQEEQATIAVMLKAGNEALDNVLKELGNGNSGGSSDGSKAEKKLDNLAKEIAKSEKMGYYEAYSVAMDRHPEIYKEYLEETVASR